MFIVKYRKAFYIFTAIVLSACIFSFVKFGLKFGIDFTGGSLSEVKYSQSRPSHDEINQAIKTLSLGSTSLQDTDNNGIIVKSKELNEAEHSALVSVLNIDGKYPLEDVRFVVIGPTVGQELRSKAITAIVIVVVLIVLYIAFAFRQVSKPISSFKYGLLAVLALIHDIIVPAGVFSYLGYKFGVEVDILFVTALLAIMGYSVSDTIVAFDRIRENLKNASKGKSFEDIVGASVSETFTRSFNTSFTTFLALIAIFIFGGDATKYLSLTLIIGIVAGTYSSIFLASPWLVTLQKWQDRK